MLLGMAVMAVVVALLVSGASSDAAAEDDAEIWVASQGTNRIFIVTDPMGAGQVETVSLPAGTGPHLVTFSPSGQYAYVSGMGNGKLEIMRADSRTIVETLSLAAGGTHQAKPSPDGKLLLVAQIPTKKLISVAVDEATESWQVTGEVVLARSPICTIYRDDGQRAYVSLLPSGIAVVDVATMTVRKTLETDGFVACGMVKSHNGKTITLASSGHGGHIYRLSTVTDQLEEDLGTIGAPDWHSFVMTPNEKLGIGTVPLGDQVVFVDLAGETESFAESVALDGTPGMSNDQPDNMAVQGNLLYVGLRASGKLAIVEIEQRRVSYIDLSPPSELNPMNCAGCPVHGVTVRPLASGQARITPPAAGSGGVMGQER
jgi:DNA-binding beta-propeller fold protein YncE